VITGINHTGIVVADLEEAIAFYTEVLGLKLVDRRERDGGPISQVLDYDNTHIKVADVVAPDGRVIELIHYLNPEPVERPSEERSLLGASHTAFNVDDMAATFAHLMASGARELNPPVSVIPGKLVCYLQDPWGNWLELIEQN
jgi:catechol 2,3-dioxygenase-like lactoylglutathione lyase family enzyme